MANDLVNVSSEYFNKGVFVFENGEYIYIEEVQYSADCIFWETSFIPYEHLNPSNPTQKIAAHLYRRVRHAGDNYFQNPSKWVAEDGKNIELRVEGEYIQYSVQDSGEWTNLILLDIIKGAQGAMGVPGEGLTISRVGIFDTKGTCTTVSTTCGCSSTSTSYVNPLTFLSLGNHLLNDTEDTGRYFKVDDLGAWTLYSSVDHAGTTAMYWRATDAIGTGAYTVVGVNVVQGSSNGYDTSGKLYMSVNGVCVEVKSIAANDHRLAETLGSTNIGFLDNFVTAYGTAVITGTGTIGIENGKLEIIDETITTEKFATNVFNDGLTNTGTEIDVTTDDLVGFGLESYLRNGLTFKDIRVNTIDLVGDGIQLQALQDVDNNSSLGIKVGDFVTSIGTNYTGLQTSTERGITEVDGFDNIYIKNYFGLEITTNGIAVKADQLSIIADVTNVRVADTDNGTLGILAKHVNQDVVDNTKGIEKIAGLVTGKLGIKLDTTDDSLDLSALGIKVKADGIKPIHLDDTIVDTTDGINIANGVISAKYDNTTIGVNAGGELEVKNLGANVVSYITDSSLTPTLLGTVVMEGTAASAGVNCIEIEVEAITLGNKINYKATIDNALFDSYVAGLGYIKTSTPTTVNWGAVGGTLSNQVDLYAVLNTKAEVNLTYGNIQIRDTGVPATSGFYITSDSGTTWFKIIVDGYGQLGT